MQGEEISGNSNHWYKTWWGITLGLVGTFILIIGIALSFYFVSLFKQAANNNSGQKIEFTGKKYEAENENSYWLGSANAKITIVEFSDFACPYSVKSFPTIRELSTKYKDKIKFVYRDYPLRQEYSADLALAARCAGEQGLFWPMHDKLFLNQGVSTVENATRLAKQIGADMNRFNDCMKNKKYISQIQKDIIDANSFEVSGTPTWFINGYKLEGDMPMKTWEEIINKFIE